MIRSIGRVLLYIGLLLILLLVGLVLTIRFAPNALMGVINDTVQQTTGYQLEVANLSVSYVPLVLKITDINVSDTQQSAQGEPLLDLVDGMVTVDLWGGLMGTGPFWSLSADQADIYIKTSPPVADDSEQQNTEAPGPVNIGDYLSFLELDVKRINLHQLDDQGKTSLMLNANVHQKTPQEIVIVLDVEQPGGSFQLAGTASLAKQEGVEVLSFTTAKLDLTPLMNSTATNEQAETDVAVASEGDDDGFISTVLLTEEAPMDWRWLNQLSELVVKLQVDELIAAEHKVSALESEIDFRDGRIAVKSLQGNYFGQQGGQPVQLPFKTEVVIEPLSIETTGADAKLTLDATVAGLSAQLSGRLNANGFSGTDVAIELGAEELGDLNKYASVDLAPLMPFSVALTATTVNENQTIAFIGLKDIAIKYGASDLAGDAELKLGAELFIKADLQSTRLQVPMLVAQSEEEEEEEEEEEPTLAEASSEAATQPTDVPTEDTPVGESEAADLFSKEPIDWSWLSIADIAINYQASQLQIVEADFTDFTTSVTAQDGLLKLEPFEASFGGGGFAVVGQLKKAGVQPETEGEESVGGSAAASGIEAELNLSLKDIQLDAFGLISEEQLQGGKTQATVDLTFAGSSSHQIAASTDGEILLTITEAVVQNDTFELVGSDLLMETLSKLNPFAKSDPTTELECALVRFVAEDGVLKSKNQLVVETTKMEIIGNGDIDLNDETLDIGISPSTKGGVGLNVGSLVKFMKVGGKLNDPKPQADAVGLAKSGAAIGAAISTGGLSIIAEGLVKQVVNAGNACEQALENN